MSAIRVNIEIGHEASPKSKKTPEGFTHDWEVFVRGQEGADISHFVEKVVFHLHNTFPKPRRVVKDPPFSIKESGYAGFTFPIELYLKNRDEPKRIQFSYNFTLQEAGSLKDRYIFQNPNDDFRKKLLRGGGIPVTNNAFYTNPDQETRNRDLYAEDKRQLVSKPKLSSDTHVKKHKVKDEIPHRASSFENLFGPPIQKPPKVSPDPKKLEKTINASKVEKKDKDKSNSDKKSKHEHKEIKPEKIKIKEDKDKIKQEKIKSHSKLQEKSKDKSNKRPIETSPSPESSKKRCTSPNRRLVSPLPRSSSASSMKEETKQIKHNSENYENKKIKVEDKSGSIKVEINKDPKEKKKKEKKSHDREREKRDKKDHKKESHKITESPKDPHKEVLKVLQKSRETPKDKDLVKDHTIPPYKEKHLKPEKPMNKFSIENLKKSPAPDNEENYENQKTKDKGDNEKKHKHKKKDKKRDESRDKNKESSKEKKHKHEKPRELPVEKIEIIEPRETHLPKERILLDPGSPISIDTASQCSSKSEIVKISQIGNDDPNVSSHSDSESSAIIEEEDSKVKVDVLSLRNIKQETSPEPEVELEPEPEPEPEPQPEPEMDHEPKVEAPPAQQKQKVKKHKDKSKKERRKRKAAAEEEDSENRKLPKATDSSHSNNETERGECSGSVSIETKVQDNGVSSSLGEDAEPGDISPDYMVQLRSLQQRIMMIKNNNDLEKVVNLIAETGRYEVTTQTFDFDLCLLDRSTVQQLIQLVGC